MRTKVLHFTFFLATILFFTNCTKKSSVTTIPELITRNATNITRSTAVSGGFITSDGGAAVTARGVCWSTTQMPTTVNNKTNDSLGKGGFNSLLTFLMANTIYYVRAYAINSVGTKYGSEVSFTTQVPIVPKVSTFLDFIGMFGTNPQMGQLDPKAWWYDCGDIISDDGGSAIITSGVIFTKYYLGKAISTRQIESLSFYKNDIHIPVDNGWHSHYYSYSVQAYATNSMGTGYGEVISFQI